MAEVEIKPEFREKILAGRNAVDAYREAHRQLHLEPWHRGIPEEHTPLLKTLVADLEIIGITSAELDFEPKKTKILAKFWNESDLLNLQELGLENKELTVTDREALRLKWQ